MRGVNPFSSHLSLNGRQREVVRPQSMENDFQSNTNRQEMMTTFAVEYYHKKAATLKMNVKAHDIFQ